MSPNFGTGIAKIPPVTRSPLSHNELVKSESARKSGEIEAEFLPPWQVFRIEPKY